MNSSHSGHLFCPRSYLLPSRPVLVALYFLQDPLQCTKDYEMRYRKTISLFSNVEELTPQQIKNTPKRIEHVKQNQMFTHPCFKTK